MEEPRSIFDLFAYDEPLLGKWRSLYSKDFSISFPKLKHGWLTISIKYPGKRYSYQASNFRSSDALKPLLEATTDLLEHIGDYDKYFGTIRTHTRAIHTDEPTEYVWDFNRRGSELRILLREDPHLEYELDRFYGNYTSEQLKLEYEDVTEESIKAPLLLAFKIDVEVFVVKLYIAYRKLLAKTSAARYKEENEKEFPLELLRRLEQWIMLHMQPFSGLWHYTDKDYRNRVDHIHDPQNFTVLGRRIATYTELEKAGLW